MRQARGAVHKADTEKGDCPIRQSLEFCKYSQTHNSVNLSVIHGCSSNK